MTANIALRFRWIVTIASALTYSTLIAAAQKDVTPTLPGPLQIPASQKLLLQVHGVGTQTYTCQANAGSYAWTLKAPDARLIGPNNQVVGRHFAGPTWELNDGSRIIGKVAASVPSPDPNAIPWLRLDVTKHEGEGKLSGVLSVQRLPTTGGKAPATGCDPAHSGAESRVPYQADYLFYGQ